MVDERIKTLDMVMVPPHQTPPGTAMARLNKYRKSRRAGYATVDRLVDRNVDRSIQAATTNEFPLVPQTLGAVG